MSKFLFGLPIVFLICCSSKQKISQIGNCEGVLINGKKQGVWTCSDIFGPVMKAEFIDGLKDGKVEMFLFGGDLESSSYWQKGRYHGPFLFFHPNGQIRYKSQYQHGQQVGPVLEFDESGNEVHFDEIPK